VVKSDGCGGGGGGSGSPIICSTVVARGSESKKSVGA